MRLLAVESLGEGAYWRLVSGFVCWLALGVVSLVLGGKEGANAACGSERVVHRVADNAEGGGMSRLSECLPMKLTSILVMLFNGSAIAILGGSTIAKLSEYDGNPTPAKEFLSHLTYLSWRPYTLDLSGPLNNPIYKNIPIIALVFYFVLLMLFVETNLWEGDGSYRPRRRQYPPVLPLSNPDKLAITPGVVAAAKGWNSAVWATLAAGAVIALLRETPLLLSSPDPITDLTRSTLDRMRDGAIYAVLVGWIPALAVLASSRILRRSLTVLDQMEDAEEPPNEKVQSEADEESGQETPRIASD